MWTRLARGPVGWLTGPADVGECLGGQHLLARRLADCSKPMPCIADGRWLCNETLKRNENP